MRPFLPPRSEIVRRAVRRSRPIRNAWLSRRIWTRRLLLLVGAVCVGLSAAAFALLADAASEVHHRFTSASPGLALLVTPLAFMAAAGLTAVWFDGAQGSGIPQVIAARASQHHAHRAHLLSARVTIGKILLTTFGLLAGASIGREGPTVQVGAAVMFAVGGLAGIGRQRGLVLAGAAAGIAAAFNTPLAGVLFAIEELAKSFERRMTAITAASVVLAGMTSMAVLGNYAYFGRVSMSITRPTDWIGVPVCGILGGVLGGVFSRALIAATRRVQLSTRGRLVRRILLAGLCGLGTALLALATANFAAGTAAGTTKLVLEGAPLLPWWYAPAKLVSTLLGSVSGIPGGLFSPSLSVGANLASMVSGAMPWMDPTTLATLTMVGYFAGVVQSPLTAFVIVMEMTTSQTTSLPLLATSLLGASISRLISREPLYHALAYGYADPDRFAGHWRKRKPGKPADVAGP